MQNLLRLLFMYDIESNSMSRIMHDGGEMLNFFFHDWDSNAFIEVDDLAKNHILLSRLIFCSKTATMIVFGSVS